MLACITSHVQGIACPPLTPFRFIILGLPPNHFFDFPKNPYILFLTGAIDLLPQSRILKKSPPTDLSVDDGWIINVVVMHF